MSVVRLLPAELLGYLTMIVPLTWIGAEMVERFPAAAIVLEIAAAAWVMYLAVKLWSVEIGTGVGGEVTFSRVCVTTMLNPKALIFGLVLLPSPAAHEYPPKIGLFILLTIGVALIWGAMGRLTRISDRGGSRLIIVQRFAAAWLGIVSTVLVASMLRG